MNPLAPTKSKLVEAVLDVKLPTAHVLGPTAKGHNDAVDDCLKIIREHESTQQDTLRKVREVLEFYAHKGSYSTRADMESSVWVDGGKRAGEALALLNDLIGPKP
jgi:hypothetical protein